MAPDPGPPPIRLRGRQGAHLGRDARSAAGQVQQHDAAVAASLGDDRGSEPESVLVEFFTLGQHVWLECKFWVGVWSGEQDDRGAAAELRDGVGVELELAECECGKVEHGVEADEREHEWRTESGV
ncbi:hypothetical protein BG003_009900 [Podila horticola]|nr:hypothetical protein BG003_009900 [Podila horticola]